MLWSPVYETGVPIMDSQHQELFRQVEILLDHSNDAGDSQIAEALDFLGKYVVQHFSTEEELQSRSKYPKFPQHQHMHEVFVDTYKKLRRQYEEGGNNPLLLMKITRTALDWLKSHIKVHDKEFAKYYIETQGVLTATASSGSAKPAAAPGGRVPRANARTGRAASTPLSRSPAAAPPRTARTTTPPRTATPPRSAVPSSRRSGAPVRPGQPVKPVTASGSGSPVRTVAKPAAPFGTASKPPLRAAPAARPSPNKKDVQKQAYPTALANLAGKLDKTDDRARTARTYRSAKVDTRGGEKTSRRQPLAARPGTAAPSRPLSPARPAKPPAPGEKKPSPFAGTFTPTNRTRY